MEDEIVNIILKACNELNEQLNNKIDVDEGKNAVLYGKDGVLDSLGLVNLVVSVESEIENTYGKSLTLIDGAAVPKEESPFRNIGLFAEFIVRRLDNGSDTMKK